MFDQSRAEKVLKFVSSLRMKDDEGKIVPVELLPFQADILTDLIANVNEDGTRIARTAFLTCSRQNGKSLCVAVLLIFFLCFSPAAIDIASVAGDKKQAAIMFKYMLGFIEATPQLADHSLLRPTKSSLTITNTRTGSRFVCLGGDGKLAHGFAFKIVAVDELHIFDGAEKRELYDAVKSSMGAQKESLIFYTTTASPQASGIAWDEYQYASKVRDGIVLAPSYRPFIYTNEPDVDVQDIAAWHRSNPGLGHTKQFDYMQESAAKASESPSNKHSFMRLDLNVWGIGSSAKWIQRDSWSNCQRKIDWTKLGGDPCYIGYDAGATTDLSAVVLLFPRPDGSFLVKPHCFMPADNMAKQGIHDGVDYERWAREGFITTTEGDMQDDAVIEKYILDQADKYTVLEFAYDRYSAQRLAASLQNHGLTVVPISPQYSGMSDPSKYVEKLIATQRLHHDGNPVLAHHVDCAEIMTDPFGRIRPVKAGGRQGKSRVDSLVSMVIGFARAQLHGLTPAATKPDLEIRFI